MRGSIRQRTPGSWELTVELGYDASGTRRHKFETVRGTKAQRRLRELLSTWPFPYYSHFGPTKADFPQAPSKSGPPTT